MNVLILALIGAASGLSGAAGTYFLGKRQRSGRVDTSEAKDLWNALMGELTANRAEQSALRSENAALRAENAALRSENATLRVDVDSLKDRMSKQEGK